MSKLIPENMREIRLAVVDAQDAGKPVNEDELIIKALQDIFQNYIDEAEEGHYDTCKLVNRNKFQIVDTNSKVFKEFTAHDDDFVNQFKANAQTLLLKLADWANQVAQ